MTKQEKLERQNRELKAALRTLVDLYVSNLGSDGKFPRPAEFIACITPPHARDLTAAERRLNRVWAAWDAARIALGEKL